MQLVALVAAAWAGDAAPALTVRACDDAPAANVVAWAIERTVSIDAGDGSGTGAVVSPDGFVLTAAHVVGRRDQVEVRFESGASHSARVIRRAPDSDLALLRFEDDDAPCLPARPTPAQVGSDVLIVGSPGGDALSHSVSKGIVSGYRRGEHATLVQTDAAINPGNSGGPMVGDEGELLGIVSFKMVGDGVEGLGFAVAATDLGLALGLRWGTESDAGDATPLEPVKQLVLPTLEPGPDTVIDPTARYVVKHSPSVGLIAGGIGIAGLGAVSAGATYSSYVHNRDTGMERFEWDALRLGNALAWGAIGAGVGTVVWGALKPSRKAPVVRERQP